VNSGNVVNINQTETLRILWGPPGDLPVGAQGQRPCGLPSHAARLNAAGHTGLPALDALKWASLPICPLTVRLIGASISR